MKAFFGNPVVCRSHRSRGFTIVELMVVVSIIFALMALLLPALSTAREYGRRAMCLSNMHQLALAMNMYADENRSQLPPYFYQVEENESNGTPFYNLAIKMNWSMANVGPLRNPNILLCPSDKNPAVINTTDPAGNPIAIQSSYGYNFEMLMQGVGIYHLRGEKVALLFDGEPDLAASGSWTGRAAGGMAGAGVVSSGLVALDKDDGTGGGPGSTNWDGTCEADANNMTWICHVPPGDPSAAHCEYVGVSATEQPDGHSNHPADRCGTCDSGCDLYGFNTQLLMRRHFSKANVIFVDGHGEWVGALASDNIYP